MHRQSLTINLPTADATATRAREISAKLRPSDTILLNGEVGTGKTHFARSLIEALLGHPEDVPSPTFTLVQTYISDAAEIWHADLYRITSTLDIEELGLVQAFDTAICIVEWPDRLGELRPEHALDITLNYTRDQAGRTLLAAWQDPRWADRIAPWLS
ncbi:MAG: tRNA (adenosine(37)-N6)-threonylcarbamoyltransferase complex ATPase subunit type 1 TsaE [Pseudomonadota bacterium]